jgi:tRNA (adenine57-N1/adenine58-N1)-methyltransferase
MAHTHEGDLAMLVGENRKQFIFKLERGDVFQTHHGIVKHDDLLPLAWGSAVESHLGKRFYLLQPSLRDLLLLIKRRSQIIFPKDLGYILLRLSVVPGARVLEAGTGSGALTMALASMVGADGQVISVDRRADLQRLARENLDLVGLGDRVRWVHSDLSDLEPIEPVNSLFLDLPDPHLLIPQVPQFLSVGGHLGLLMPSANQVSDVLSMITDGSFIDIDVCEILLRFYKTVPARLRPTDRMVAHTGYLLFARLVANG